MAKKSIREVLHYNPQTGNFKSLKTGRNNVGYVAKDGYRRIYFGRRQYLAHRLAWLWITGEWPRQDIDHINRKRSDNRWRNLREVSRSVNCRNNRLNGRAGVSWDNPGQGRRAGWKVYIWRQKVGHIHIGRYKTKAKAMQIAALFLGGS